MGTSEFVVNWSEVRMFGDPLNWQLGSEQGNLIWTLCSYLTEAVLTVSDYCQNSFAVLHTSFSTLERFQC